MGICPLSIDDGLRLGIVFAGAETVAEQPNSCVTVSVTIHTDMGGGGEGRTLLLSVSPSASSPIAGMNVSSRHRESLLPLSSSRQCGLERFLPSCWGRCQPASCCTCKRRHRRPTNLEPIDSSPYKMAMGSPLLSILKRWPSHRRQRGDADGVDTLKATAFGNFSCPLMSRMRCRQCR